MQKVIPSAVAFPAVVRNRKEVLKVLTFTGFVQNTLPAWKSCFPVSRSGPPALRALPLRRSEEHTSELQSRSDLVCRLLLEKKKEQPARRWLVVRQERTCTARSPPARPRSAPSRSG